jgi:hypothetical protein
VIPPLAPAAPMPNNDAPTLIDRLGRAALI